MTPDIAAITASGERQAEAGRDTTAPEAARATRFDASVEQANPKAMVKRILVNWAKAIAAYEYRLNSLDSAVRQVRARRVPARA